MRTTQCCWSQESAARSQDECPNTAGLKAIVWRLHSIWRSNSLPFTLAGASYSGCWQNERTRMPEPASDIAPLPDDEPIRKSKGDRAKILSSRQNPEPTQPKT